MPEIDLVFEGGGAKGAVFVGALEVLLEERGYRPGRLLGTSAGAITAVLLAAGYSVPEMQAALAEKDAAGKPVFAAFLGKPAPFDQEEIRYSAIRKLLQDLNLPLLPDAAEDRMDDWIAHQLAAHDFSRHIFSFIERGGWFSADSFVAWLQSKLDQPAPDGSARSFGQLTLAEFHDATGTELTLVAADTTVSRMLLLNHRTAPDLPVVWAARMSMSVPLLWQEVEWRKEWGEYRACDQEQHCLAPLDIVGHAIVDGGLLSNFPIALFLSDRPDACAIVGASRDNRVLGLLIDESIPVPGQPPREATSGLGVASTRTVQRLRHLMNTATTAHDNMAMFAFPQHVVHLPAGGYGTTEFDMSDDRREALVAAGRQAMLAFLDEQPSAGVVSPQRAAEPVWRGLAGQGRPGGAQAG